MSRLKRLLVREDGIALATVVAMMAVLTTLSIVLIDQVTAESNRAATATRADTVFQAAEAGLNDYLAKLLDDPQFYDHYVANGESTRRVCNAFSGAACTALGATVAPGQSWTPGTGWIYQNGKDTWYQGTGSTTSLSSGGGNLAYNLMISPPKATTSTGSPARAFLTIVSTGCRLITGGTTCDPNVPRRTAELHLLRTTPANFSFMYGETPTQWGETATTYGRIYSLGDIIHNGTTYGDLLAEGVVSGSTTWMPGAHRYDSTPPDTRASCPSGSNPPCPLRSAIQFSTFSTSLSDIKRAAALNTPGPNGTSFNYPGAVMRIVFGAGTGTAGTVQVWSCTGVTTPEASEPPSGNCTSRYNGALPANGAIYSEQDAIVSTSTTGSVVNGHVTVASNADIIIGGNIHYTSEPSYGAGANDDVLGLIANRDVWVAKYAPNQLFWRAALIAENGMESVYDCKNPPNSRGSTSKMTFVGSMATSSGDGCAAVYSGGTLIGGYASRDYIADDGSLSQYNALQFLFPPWYPVLDTQATVLFREVPSSFVPPAP